MSDQIARAYSKAKDRYKEMFGAIWRHIRIETTNDDGPPDDSGIQETAMRSGHIAAILKPATFDEIEVCANICAIYDAVQNPSRAMRAAAILRRYVYDKAAREWRIHMQ